MYDSEGKILKDKKEAHDKLQAEEAQKRRKINRDYLSEQSRMQAQLQKGIDSARGRSDKGRSNT